MQIFRTATCVDSNHPEFTLVFKDEPSTPNTVGWILDHFQNAVAEGTRFVPGQTVGIGWRALRIIERDDRTLGLEERVAEGIWEEHVDQALSDVWLQVEAAAKLGLPEEPDSVAEDDIAAAQVCAFEASTLSLNRLGPDSPQHGVWAISCGDEHDHSEWSAMELFQLSASLPFVTQFLALPPETGLVIDRRWVRSTGGVVAGVAYQGTMLTPDDGIHFGPEPASIGPLPTAHFAILQFGEGLYRTTIGDQHGHPDIVARVTEPAVPGTQESLVQWILDDLQDSLAAGTRFAPGQTIRVGGRTLRVVERSDGMLGLLERVDTDSWEEHVEQTLRDLWYQKEVAASLGLAQQLDFPADDQYAAVAECVNETIPALLLNRGDTSDPDSSGWMVCCLRNHDHGEWSMRTIWDLSDSMPFTTQFLALPVNTSVAIEAPHTTPTGRIGVRALLNGWHLIPAPGSYLSALNASH
ncbi:hypothetical protein OG874_05105 [Nocardia sp. NBC_00565]|uniref:hypothetical protein n=1 Tax=Nocardia sp. NBC_00565 TaxID=2975993 RepID=UPI002E8138F7|nr:hypothetical protein [Nocardia sp. NBC_00565]WUC04572.1 hypothetical protein OG874_05105 [Nocardia sp. NBC_00565]